MGEGGVHAKVVSEIGTRADCIRTALACAIYAVVVLPLISKVRSASIDRPLNNARLIGT